MKTIRIGKAEDNDFVVRGDSHVSRHHAILTCEDNGEWSIEDLESTNGTFVNGSQISKKNISTDDLIYLGDVYVLHFNDILRLGKDDDYSEEFDALKEVYTRYVNEKVRIQSSNQFKTRLLQSLPFAFPGIIGVIFGFLGKGSPEFLMGSLVVAICAPTIGVYMGARQSAKIPGQLQDLANQFKIDYICPKCGMFLGEIPWKSLKNRKQCLSPSCKAKWG